MRQRIFSLLFCAVPFMVACNPPAVDPNADFTIEGDLISLDGSPAVETKVYIYKVDSVWSKENNFLQYATIDAPGSLNPNDTYHATSDSTGHFEITLKGRDVNTDGGGGAAYLTVVYFYDGIEDAYLATASDWHFFRNEDPDWNTGELKLWDGGTASQDGFGDITFSWASDPAPSGNSAAVEVPSFLFVWDYHSDDSLPKWADHVFETSVTVPRAAFKDAVDPPEYFVTTFSKDGSRYFQHRSNWHSKDTAYILAGWTSTGEGLDLVVGSSALFEGSPSTPFSGDSATDGSMDSFYNFVGTSTHDFYIDLNGSQSFAFVFLYDLVVRYYGNAVITVHACDEATVGPSCGTQVGSAHTGDWEFVGEDAFVYLANEGGATAEWIRVSVEQKGGTGSMPYFDGVSEIRVVQ